MKYMDTEKLDEVEKALKEDFGGLSAGGNFEGDGK